MQTGRFTVGEMEPLSISDRLQYVWRGCVTRVKLTIFRYALPINPTCVWKYPLRYFGISPFATDPRSRSLLITKSAARLSRYHHNVPAIKIQRAARELYFQ